MFHWLLDTDGRSMGLNDTCTKLQFALIVAVAIFTLSHTVVLMVSGTAHWFGYKEGASDMSRNNRSAVDKSILTQREPFLGDGVYGPSQGRSTWNEAEADLQKQLEGAGVSNPNAVSEGTFTEGQLEKIAHGYMN
jgi:hypothetical protein